jgi:Tfp pilus assembly protein PilN
MGSLVKRSLGVSLRGECASFVLLEKTLGRVRLRTSGTFPLPQASAPTAGVRAGGTGPEPPQATGPDTPARGLPLKPRPDEVIVGLPRRSIMLRSLELPAINEKDLAGLLGYELERHLPFASEEAYYGFQRVKQDGEKIRVLLAAAKKADVDRDVQQLETVGLRPTAVGVSAFAAVNALSYEKPPKKGEVLCLIALDGGQAEVSVMRERAIVSSRAIPLHDGSLQPILEEIQRVRGNGLQAPMRIRVCGGSQELCTRLQTELGLPAEGWNPAAVPVDASAFGLALKGLVKLPIHIDLLSLTRGRNGRERAVVVMFALLALLACLGGALGLHSAYRERMTLRQLGQRVAEVKAQAAEVEALKAEFTRLRNRLQALDGIAQERGKVLPVLRELVSLLPAGVALTEVSLDGSKLQIRGSTGGSASDLISAFGRSSLLENAAFTSPISVQGKDRQGFQLQVFVKKGDQGGAISDQPSATGKKP